MPVLTKAIYKFHVILMKMSITKFGEAVHTYNSSTLEVEAVR
jgi:hypothetical protein